MNAFNNVSTFSQMEVEFLYIQVNMILQDTVWQLYDMYKYLLLSLDRCEMISRQGDMNETY